MHAQVNVPITEWLHGYPRPAGFAASLLCADPKDGEDAEGEGKETNEEDDKTAQLSQDEIDKLINEIGSG